jgi:hypothetical protein
MAPCPGGNLAQAGCFLSIRKTTIFELMGWLKEIGSGWGLHPLIHTMLKFNLVQDMVSCQCNKKAPTDRLL